MIHPLAHLILMVFVVGFLRGEENVDLVRWDWLLKRSIINGDLPYQDDGKNRNYKIEYGEEIRHQYDQAIIG